MDLRRYKELKGKNKANVVVVGNLRTLVSHKYDPETGERKADDTVHIEEERLLEQIAQQQSFVDNLLQIASDAGITVPKVR